MTLLTQYDQGQFLLKEVRAFYRAEYKTSVILLVLGVLSIIGGVIAIVQHTMLHFGLSIPLLLSGGLYVTIYLQTFRRIQVRELKLCNHLLTDRQLAGDEQSRTLRLHERWSRLHMYAIYSLGIGIFVTIIPCLLGTYGFVLGLGTGLLVQSALCVVLLLTSQYKLKLYQHALSKLDELHR